MKKTILVSVLAACTAVLLSLIALIMYYVDFKTIKSDGFELVLPMVVSIVIAIMAIKAKKPLLFMVPAFILLAGYLGIEEISLLVIGEYATIDLLALVVYVVAIVLASLKDCKYSKMYIIVYTAIIIATLFNALEPFVGENYVAACMYGSYALAFAAILAYFCSFYEACPCCKVKAKKTTEEVKEETQTEETPAVEEVKEETQAEETQAAEEVKEETQAEEAQTTEEVKEEAPVQQALVFDEVEEEAQAEEVQDKSTYNNY